jgi:sodium transport system ATP-binding protein
MIRAEGLSKTFLNGRRAVRAVDNVSFEVNPGEIVGILGPNGAGKTTVLRILATVLRPSSGTATVSGFDVQRDSALVRSHIGFLSGDMGLYGRLTPREIFTFFGKLGGLRGEALNRRLQDVIAALDLQAYADTRADRLSTGYRQRTAIWRDAARL